jgi:C_GCAxxG_C_C family probable redox protein
VTSTPRAESRTRTRALQPSPLLTRAEQAELDASAYYEVGYHCGEAVVRAVHKAVGASEFSEEVMRLASGFCEGLGGSRCVCGALAGGVMACGLIAGRNGPDEPWEPSYYATAELRRRWIEDQDAETCDEVVSRIGGMHLPERWAHCTLLVGRTARWVVEVTEEAGCL